MRLRCTVIHCHTVQRGCHTRNTGNTTIAVSPTTATIIIAAFLCISPLFCRVTIVRNGVSVVILTCLALHVVIL